MVIPGRVGVQDFLYFSISVVLFAGMGETDDRIDWDSQKKNGWGVSMSFFTLGHIKFESPRGLRRKPWIHTFGIEIDDFTQEKHMLFRRQKFVKHAKVLSFNNAKPAQNL